jgi:hypothetical protein
MKAKYITHGEQTFSYREWAIRLGMSYGNFLWRVKNWGPERAVTEPVRHKTKN